MTPKLLACFAHFLKHLMTLCLPEINPRGLMVQDTKGEERDILAIGLIARSRHRFALRTCEALAVRGTQIRVSRQRGEV